MAKSHGLSLQFIRIELSGFNVEPEWNDLVSGEYNNLQMTFYKLGKIYTSGLQVLYLFLLLSQNLTLL
jgi:hypothetical protein